MTAINNFTDINEFLTATAIDINMRFKDFVIFEWENVKDYNCLNEIPYRKHFFEITFQVEGQPVYLDHYPLSGTGNKLFFANPYSLQSCDASNNADYNGFTILFTPEFLHLNPTNNIRPTDQPLLKYFSRPELLLTEKTTAEFIALFTKIKEEYQQEEHVFSREIIKHYLQILLLTTQKYAVHNDPQTTVISRSQEMYNQFMDLVHQFSFQQSGVRYYADAMHVTPKHLSETIKQISGNTALQIIHNARIHYAKSLLRQTGSSISEIADAMNFESADYFSAFFKKHTGVNPLKYRQS